MLSPSAAPRWNSTTRRLRRVPLVSTPQTVRSKKLGIAVVATSASAPFFRKILRVIDIGATPAVASCQLSEPKPELLATDNSATDNYLF